MNISRWMLILFTLTCTAVSAEVIESVPLSIQDDGTRKIIDGPKHSSPLEHKEIIKVDAVEVEPESLEEVDATTKENVLETPTLLPTVAPADGNLKLEETPAAESPQVLSTPARVPDVAPKAAADEDMVALAFSERNALSKYIQFSYSFLNSKYKKINPTLEDGSNVTSFRFVSDIGSHMQTGFGVEVITDRSNQNIPDNVRSLAYRLFVDYHSPFYKGSLSLDWVAGLSLSVGDFGVKRRYLNAQNEEVSVKIKEGTIFGLIPALGIRIYLVGKNSFDLIVEYHQYFGNPQSYIGGLAIAPRLNFEF